MKKIVALSRENRGETLVEVMVSILVFALSSILLFTMIDSSTRINQTTKTAEATRQEQLTVAEADPDPDTALSAVFTVTCDALQNDDAVCESAINVKIAQKQDPTAAQVTFSDALYSFAEPRAEESDDNGGENS